VNTTAALVLAAGASRRFGSAKLLVSFNGQSLLAHSIASAEAVLPGRVHVVLGAHGDALAAHTGRARVIHNPQWSAGLSSSIVAGIEALGEDVDHLLLLLADQAALSAGHLVTLLQHHRQHSLSGITCARYNGVLGIPAVFSRHWFPTLLNLHGDQGARDLLRSDWAPVSAVDIPAAAIDIDRVEDMQTLRDHLQSDGDFL